MSSTKTLFFDLEISQLCWLFLAIFGGAMRDRTADLLDANQALSQLSYSPIAYTLKELCYPASGAAILLKWLS